MPSKVFETYATLCCLAAAAGAINAIAGGGTLLTFPALHAALSQVAGVGPALASVQANATSTVALVPGALAALAGYGREIHATRRWAFLLAAPSLLGGLLGSVLVVALPPELFSKLVPWLILTAALLFALQPRIARWTGISKMSLDKPDSPAPPRTVAKAMAFQFAVSIYGGYFGAGAGILMLSALAMIGLANIHHMNALKCLLGFLINIVSTIVFVVERQVNWPFAVAMAISAIAGGFFAARAARRFDSRRVRAIVVVIGFSLASYYFYKQFFGGTSRG